VIDEILGTTWADSVKAWALRADGSYARLEPNDGETVRSQQRFMELTRERAREPETILGLSSKSTLPGPARALDKLRRRGKKRKRQRRLD
jgi:hypothetical protein